MKKIYFFSMVILSLLMMSCNQDSYTDDLGLEGDLPQQSGGTINKSGAVDGLTYTLQNISVNPDLLILKDDEVSFTGTDGELKQGIIQITSIPVDLAQKLVTGTVMYIRKGDYTAIRKIETVTADLAGGYRLETSQAQLGEAFEGGSIDLSVNLYEKSIVEEVNSPRLKSARYGVDYIHELINITNTYNWGGFQYNPSTNVKMLLNMGLSFKKGQMLPSRLSTVFEMQLNINPSLDFTGSYNNKYQDDLVKYVPRQMIDFLKAQEFKIDIPINALGIESLPATLTIKDINIPTEIEANLSKESSFNYAMNGSFKVGYAIDVKGLKATYTPIYENTIVTKNPSALSLNGELLTKSEIVIVPNIALLDNAYNVSGDIKFGVETTSNGNIVLPGKTPVFGSKGVFTSGMNVLVDLILIKVPINIFNSQTELWNIGTIDKTITYYDLAWNVTSQNTTNILAGTRLYTTDFTLNYKYPILGKHIPEKLYISYEVYQQDGKSRLLTIKDAIIEPANVTANSFTFKFNIPYKKEGGIFSTKYQTKSFIKNIVIKDDKGYVYEGIFNTSKNIIENSFEINR